jgi:hypothetical protein
MSVTKGAGPGSDAKYALDVMNFTEMKELPAKYNSGAMGKDPEALVNRAIQLMTYPRDKYYNAKKNEFASPNWPGVLADYFYNIMIPQISPDKRPAVQTKVDMYMINHIKGRLLPELQGPNTALMPPQVSGKPVAAPAPAPTPMAAPAPAPTPMAVPSPMAAPSPAVTQPAVNKGSGPGSDAKYALDVMNFTEMKELPGKFNSGVMGKDPEALVNRAIQLMTYPRDNYYNSHKNEFASPNWPGVLADYFYNIMIPQISPDKRPAVQTKVDMYMTNIIKGVLVPQLQGTSTAPMPPAVAGGAAAPMPSTPMSTQAPATISNTSPSPIPAVQPVIPAPKPIEATSQQASLPPVPRQVQPPPPMLTPQIQPNPSVATTTMQGSAPAAVIQAKQPVISMPSQPTILPQKITEAKPVPVQVVAPTTRVLANEDKKVSMDLLMNVLNPNSLADMEDYEKFIKTLPQQFFEGINIYAEDYFTKPNTPTLQFIDTIYRMYKPFESKYYGLMGQSPTLPFERTFKLFIVTLINNAAPILRYSPIQIASLRNSIKSWIPPANRVAAQPKVNKTTYPAAATPSYYTQPNLFDLAASVRKTIREQLKEMNITAGVASSPTSSSSSSASPSLIQGLQGMIKRADMESGKAARAHAKSKDCPNCYPTPWTPDNIPFNPDDYIRKDRIPCANCRIP